MELTGITATEALEYYELNNKVNDLKKQVEIKKEAIKKAMLDSGEMELKFPNGIALSINNKNTRDWVPDYENPGTDPLQVYLTATGALDAAFTRVLNKDAVNGMIKAGRLDKNMMDALKQITRTSSELRVSRA